MSDLASCYPETYLNSDRDIHGQPADEMIHVDLASDIVKALYNQDMLSS